MNEPLDVQYTSYLLNLTNNLPLEKDGQARSVAVTVEREWMV